MDKHDPVFALVTTTINVPHLLEMYARDAARFGRNVEQFIVVGDKKTPADTAGFCRQVGDTFGLQCRYVSVAEQEALLSRWPSFADFLPWNCIQRRNVGLLLAYEGTADIVVTIDDDNFISQADYLGCHAHLGQVQEVEAVSSQTGWWNVCELLTEARGIPFYHRGYPLSQRWREDEQYKTISTISNRVAVNAGLWLDDPDVDAVTRLYFPVQATGPSSSYRERIACDIGTWSPFNSQNTALLREVIPAYLLFPHVGRYDDIWASYVVRHISDFIGDVVTYGAPLVRQKRNPHNYFRDFDAERFGLEYNDIFIEALRSCVLSSRDYRGAYREIEAQFPHQVRRICGERRADPGGFDQICRGFSLWKSIFDDLAA